MADCSKHVIRITFQHISNSIIIFNVFFPVWRESRWNEIVKNSNDNSLLLFHSNPLLIINLRPYIHTPLTSLQIEKQTLNKYMCVLNQVKYQESKRIKKKNKTKKLKESERKEEQKEMKCFRWFWSLRCLLFGLNCRFSLEIGV